MIFSVIFYSRDHGTNSSVELQHGLQKIINMRVIIVFATIIATRSRARNEKPGVRIHVTYHITFLPKSCVTSHHNMALGSKNTLSKWPS